MKKTWILAHLAVAALGCEDPLKPAERIDEPRILGVRVSNERSEASLVPGEPAQAEVLVAGPDGPQPARVAYRFCEAASSERGVPYCAGAAFAEGTADLADGPVAVDVPAELGTGLRLALLGAACSRGEPALGDTPLSSACSDGAEPLRFSFDAWTLGDTPRLNPDLSGLGVTLGGNSAALVGADVAPVCDDATLTLEAGRKHRLEVELGAAAQTGKELQLSHFSTRGELTRQFSFVSDKQPPHVALTWQAPREAGPVKQYLVVRDGLGGVSWVTWNVCVR
jgi:hypothetical protein